MIFYLFIKKVKPRSSTAGNYKHSAHERSDHGVAA